MYLWEGPISRTLTASDSSKEGARIRSKKNSHLFLVGMENNTATLEDALAVSYKTKHSHTVWCSSHTPWYLSKDLSWKPNVHTKAEHKYIETLHIIAIIWKQRCPSVSKWKNKL